eukprot:TRINITY_DN68848_c0_g1_i1.p1 TRINITY_DN68848_c0_g1~~TRINITY_DN68848_c0_g1_i1.p1  ORF type:complete len:430 (-),score=66.38 TRINITY_DN68848_c0_g1_i1:174-1463(-)
MSHTTGLGRHDLLLWANSTMQTNYAKLEQFADGVVYCQLFDAAHPGKIPLHKLNYNAQNETEYEKNLLTLKDAMGKCGITKEICTDKLKKARLQDNHDLLSWFYIHVQQKKVDFRSYDAHSRRQAACERQYKIAHNKAAHNSRHFAAKAYTLKVELDPPDSILNQGRTANRAVRGSMDVQHGSGSYATAYQQQQQGGYQAQAHYPPTQQEAYQHYANPTQQHPYARGAGHSIAQQQQQRYTQPEEYHQTQQHVYAHEPPTHNAPLTAHPPIKEDNVYSHQPTIHQQQHTRTQPHPTVHQPTADGHHTHHNVQTHSAPTRQIAQDDTPPPPPPPTTPPPPPPAPGLQPHEQESIYNLAGQFESMIVKKMQRQSNRSNHVLKLKMETEFYYSKLVSIGQLCQQFQEQHQGTAEAAHIQDVLAVLTEKDPLF